MGYESRLEKGYVRKDKCSVCGKEVLTEEGIQALEEFIAADQGFDAGEFGSIDYYEPFCQCEGGDE